MLYQNWQILENDRSFHTSVKRLVKAGYEADILLYQKNNLDQALSFVNNWSTAIDGGANYGLMSFHMNSRFDKVLAFEIDSDIRQCLETNMKYFRCNNVQIESCGLGETEKYVDIVRMSKSFGNFINPESTGGNFIIKPIDSYQLDNVGFIKLDCEGYEPLIIQGAEQTIKKSFPVILMERKKLVKKYNFGSHETEGLLQRWGYNKLIDLGKDVILVKT
jgi:FkbM family methyltransferase